MGATFFQTATLFRSFVFCDAQGIEQRISVHAYQAVFVVCKLIFLHQVIKVIIEFKPENSLRNY